MCFLIDFAYNVSIWGLGDPNNYSLASLGGRLSSDCFNLVCFFVVCCVLALLDFHLSQLDCSYIQLYHR